MIKRGYCSITVANYDGTWLIRFISKSYIHPQKDFANKFHLVLHACICLFVKKISPTHPKAAVVTKMCGLVVPRWKASKKDARTVKVLHILHAGV